MLVNVVDVPPLCNFILPAIVRQGPLAIAISTAGASPALAKRMKREIAEAFGEPYARLALILNDARAWAKATLPTYQDRKAFFEGIVNGEPDPIELLRAGGDEAAKRTGGLIRRCRPLPLASVGVEADVAVAEGTVTIVAEARTTAQTGVEMEARTAATVAALTVYDMVKGLERGVEVTEVT